ncbi:MAG TPA: aminopeptidase [Gemmatimonadales bacterium]|jgi:predicted aminopeptidase|nr:aminopeptidase [Gemmatimonadales bacterium]
MDAVIVDRRGAGRWTLMRRLLARLALGAAVLVVLALILFPDFRYLARGGWEEARILLRRRSLRTLVADPKTPAALVQRLKLVLAARAYASDSLHLTAGDTYTTYADVGRDTLLLVLSASRRDKLREVTWHYPIVGTVPYKGFFNPASARRAAADLEQAGNDVYLRVSDAFSTLGYFSDPLLSTAVDRDTMELVATVIHELAHNTLYVPSNTPFDESFANFVGYRGAQAFFRSRGDTSDANRAAARWRDERTLDVFFAELARRLDSVYATPLSGDALQRARADLFGWARAQLTGTVGQGLETYDWRWFAKAPLNNAVVVAQRLYRMNLNLFDDAYLANRVNLAETIRVIKLRVLTQPGADPYLALYSRPDAAP